jgi:hypothetical protein
MTAICIKYIRHSQPLLTTLNRDVLVGYSEEDWSNMELLVIIVAQ